MGAHFKKKKLNSKYNRFFFFFEVLVEMRSYSLADLCIIHLMQIFKACYPVNVYAMLLGLLKVFIVNNF